MDMEGKQLRDLLTAHISLYHSLSSKRDDDNNNPRGSRRRSSILKWLSSQTVQQRQAHLTVVNPKLIQIMIQMRRKMIEQGHGFFIILPDMPDSSTQLPTLCFRRSNGGGLLSRYSQFNQSEISIYQSIRLFNSCSSSSATTSTTCCLLDSMTVCEDFVSGDLDRFVSAMDGVSNGEFLTGDDDDDINDEWFELDWLKSKGYYSLESFAANSLELALRLSYCFHFSSSSSSSTSKNKNKNNKNNNKKNRGPLLLQKSKDKVVLASNVFSRHKGCIDWWLNLHPQTKTKLFRTFFGKAAKSLTFEILKGANNAVEDEMWLFSAGAEKPLRYNCRVSCRRTIPTLARTDMDIGSIATPASLAHVFNRLVVLQDILALLSASQQSEYDKEKLFFSSLGSVGTISDCISRKLRGLLMLISLDCTKHELLEEGNLRYPPKKSKEKPCATSRRKKGKTRVKRPNAVPISSGNDLPQDELPKDQGSRLAHTKNGSIIESNCLTGTHQGKDLDRDVLSSAVDMVERGRGLVNGKVQTAAGESSKESNKNNSSGVEDPAVVGDFQMRMKVSTSRAISEVETAKANCMSDKSIIQSVSNDISIGSEKVLPMSSQSSIIPPVMPLREVDDVLSNGALFCENGVHLCETDTKAVFSGEPTKAVDPDEKPPLIREQESVNNYDIRSISSSGCPSHEWPTVAPFHFPSINPHLPAATDRLHLDVGHNWHNHFHHSFVPTVHHQEKSSSMENGARVLSRPLPMSLDWPPMVRSFSGLAAPSLTCSYDSGFVDLSDPKKSPELGDELENHWISEEEYEVHAVSGKDYNQYFGGGVMYWNSSDHPGPSFSRPPSLSSDDSSWAWREADINRAVDDMVAFSSSYSTNGLTSPSAASFCSPFDPLGSAHQAIGYVIPGSEVADVMVDENASGSVSNLPGDGDTKAGDSLPYPILRPIIVPNVARERSRSDFKRGHDHKSPCVPPNRQDQPRIKRPPSPVVLCVPRAPLPPPPSPVSDSRKHRGFPTVRSGSSSPRHWGVKGWFHDGINFEEACVRMDGSEVVWPSWRNKILSAGPMIQPLPGALLQDRLIAISQLARDQEHPDVAFPLQPPELLNCATRKASLSLLYSLLHDEIDSFCKQVATENMIRKPYVNWAVKRVTRSLQVLWPRSRTNIFGSNATGLSLPTSDVDLVVCLPPVRNLEPIKEAGILEGRNGIKETCLQHAARYLANQEWVKSDSLKIVENTAIPIIMLVVEVPHDLIISAASNVQTLKEEPTKIIGEQDMIGLENSASPKCTHISNDKGNDAKSVRLDISFKSPSHTGLQTTELVKELTEQFPAATPLALVLKQFLADRTLDQSYSGGLSSYCLVLLITRFLQHEHHFGRPINQSFGCLLMDFLYFFGNVFDPRQMRISVQGSGVYINRERGYSIDPIYIDDPLFPANNVGRNCFRIHQCIKAFADAYSILENELACLPNNGDSSSRPPYKLLQKIIPSIGLLQGL